MNFNLAYKVRDTAAAIFSVTLEVLLDSFFVFKQMRHVFCYLPRQIDGWKMTFPFNMAPFQGDMLIFGGVTQLNLTQHFFRICNGQMESHPFIVEFTFYPFYPAMLDLR